jgi:hypothetical protein
MEISGSLVLFGAVVGMLVVVFGLALYFMGRTRLYRR